MLRKLLLLLIAPCAAPTASLVAAEVVESPQPKVEASSVQSEVRSSRVGTLTRRCMSPVAKALDSLRITFTASPVQAVLEVAIPAPFETEIDSSQGIIPVEKCGVPPRVVTHQHRESDRAPSGAGTVDYFIGSVRFLL